MEEQGGLGQWLQERCKREHLSLRKAAAETGLSHAAIAAIRKGARPSAVTIKKLVAAFSDGKNQRLALEDKLLVLAGYRTERPEEERNEPVAQLIDRVKGFNQRQIKVMVSFADFLAEIDEGKAARDWERG